MKKSDLKTGMIAKTRRGQYAKILLNTSKGDILAGNELEEINNHWCFLSNYNEDLISNWAKDSDIVAIYDQSNNENAASIKNKGKLLWERKEVKELTVKEISDLLGYPIKIIK